MMISTIVIRIFGYFLFSNTYIDFARPEVVCLEENVVTRWDLSLYSDIAYVYIKHKSDLIVFIETPNDVFMEEPYKNRIQINVTDAWLVEMTMYNVTFATNGTYKGTIGFMWKPEIIINKEISVIDPEINISLDTSDNDCKKVKCASKYNVTLTVPNSKKTKENLCLSEDDNGIFFCCLSNKSPCPSKSCKSIDVSKEDNTTKYHKGNFEYTTKEISTTTQVDQRNTNIILYCTIPVILILGSIALLILFRRKFELCKEKTQIIWLQVPLFLPYSGEGVSKSESEQ